MPANAKSFKAGEVMFYEGDASTCLYIIQKGVVAIRKSKGSDTVEIARLGLNEVIGELSFFDHKPRSATAAALTDVDVLEIDFASLEKIYATVPDYIKTMMAAVSARLRRANELIRRLQKEGAVADIIEGEDGGAGAGSTPGPETG